MATIISTRLTVSALGGLPEGDGNRCELIEGELHVTTQRSIEHQIVSDAVVIALHAWNRTLALKGIAVSAPGIILAADEAFAPDVVWYSAERLQVHRRPDGKFYGPPDLAVEVLSRVTKTDLSSRRAGVCARHNTHPKRIAHLAAVAGLHLPRGRTVRRSSGRCSLTT